MPHHQDPCTANVRPRHIHRPMLVWVPALALGIAIAEFEPPAFTWAMGAAALIGVIWAALKDQTGAAVCLASGLVIAGGMLLAWPGLHPNPADHAIARHADGNYHRVRGTILELPRVSRLKTTLVLGHLSIFNQDKWAPITGRIRLSVNGSNPDLMPGSGLAFNARIRRIRGSRNPGGFDYARHMGRHGLYASAWVRPKALTASVPTRMTWRLRLHQVRHAIGRRIDQAVPLPSSAILRALLIGDTARILPDHREFFARLGISHILAISGLHIGLMAAASFGLIRWLLAWVPFLRSRGWVAKTAALATLGPVIAYGLLAGATPATLRAMMMAAVFLIAVIIDRHHDPLNTLAVAAMVILLGHPASLWAISFQLSFTAVAAILLGFRILSARWGWMESPRSTIRHRVLQWIGAATATSLFATLGTLPLVLHHFHRISVVSLPANLLLAPVLTLMIIPMGLAGLALLPISESLANLLLIGAGQLLDPLLNTAATVTTMDWLAPYAIGPNALEIALYYGIGACLVFWAIPSPQGKNRQQSGKTGRHPGWVTAMALTLMTIGMADIGYWHYQRYWRTSARVTAIDVGAGSATLMELPGGFTVLVDGGGASTNARFDVGHRIVAPVLWRRKIKTVDLIILSHPNADHVNGLTFVARWFAVGQVWSNGDTARTRSYKQFARTLRKRGIAHHAVNDSRPPLIRGEATVQILHPLSSEHADQHSRYNSNNRSTVVCLRYAGTGVLVPGDIEKEAEAALVTHHLPELATTVVMAPHHGSRTSSSPSFVAATQARHVVISARTNQAAPEVMDRYSAQGAKTWKTWEDGAITMAITKSGLAVSGMGPRQDPLTAD